MALEIEKGVPLPADMDRKGRHLSPLAVAFRQMEIGDCVLIPNGTYKFPHNSIGIQAKRAGIRVAIRVEEGGHRAWRIA